MQIPLPINQKDNPVTFQYCRWCGEELEMFNQDLHTHHIVPRSRGGSNYMDNLITLCRNCHVEIHRELGVKMGK